MENFSINFLIKETKSELNSEIFINKIKLKKEFLVLLTQKTNIFFPLIPKSPPFFLSKRKISGEDIQTHEINIFRKYLENSILMDIEKPFFERIVFLKFKKMMIWGEEKEFFFIINCATLPNKWYITDESKKIIFSKNDTDAISGTTFLPPTTEKEELTFEKLEEIKTLSPKEIARKYKGFSTNYAKELLNRKNKEEFLKKLFECRSEGGFYYKKDCYPLKMESLEPSLKLYQTFLECIENRFFEKLHGEQIAKLKNKLLKKIKKEIDKKEKLLKKMYLELKDAEKGEELIKKAQILSSNFHKLKKGMGKIKVFDFFENKEVELTLNPELTPQENISRLYRKATRLKRKLPIVKERIEELKGEINHLKDNLFLVETAENIEELSEFEEKKAKKGKNRKEEVSGIVKVELEDGFFVYVGKNSKANHIIYTQKLSKNDLWFHAKDIPGSHVVLKNTKNLNPDKIPEEIIEKAASIAAYYSKGRNNTLVEVQYTTKDNLFSSKGKGAGFVLLRKFKTINVKPFSGSKHGN